MDAFVSDITSIFDLINDNKDSKSIVNSTIMSKQYLGYYLYRIFTKYILFLKMHYHRVILKIYSNI